jgi:hypothetical protein
MKITPGSLHILNGLVYNVSDSVFIRYAQDMLQYLLDVIQKNEDMSCTKLALGVIADISNCIGS